MPFRLGSTQTSGGGPSSSWVLRPNRFICVRDAQAWVVRVARLYGCPDRFLSATHATPRERALGFCVHTSSSPQNLGPYGVAMTPKGVVPLAGLEPALAAYLALTGYKSAALPIELQGRDRSIDHAGIRNAVLMVRRSMN